MICVKCQRNIQDDSIFCCYCGRKQAKLPRKNPKRANGLGSVYYDEKRKMWIAQVVIGRRYTEDHKVRFSYRRLSFKSKTDAMKAVRQIDEQQERPAFTIAYYYHTFETGKMADLSRDKQYAYKSAYRRLKTLWDRPVKDLSINDLQAILGGIREQYYPCRDIRALLNYIFRLAAADDRSINPALPSFLQLPKLEETQVEPFTEEEQLQLWYSYEEGNQDAAVPLIMIYTGLMTGELRRLRKDMIDLEHRQIINAGLKTEERKKKTVLLPDDIIPVLDDLIQRTNTDLLFPMGENAFYKMYYDAIKAAGITRHLTPYSCRHTTATVLAVHENVAPQTLQRVMRWKSTRMMDRYVTPTDDDARKAVNKI